MSLFVDVLGGLTDDAGYKSPCVAATTVDLGTALTGLLVIDGVQTASGDRVLVWRQANPTTNGIYVVSVGAWSRALDFSSSNAILDGTQVLVAAGGTVYGGAVFICQVSRPVVGTTPITFSLTPGSTPTPPAIEAYREIIAGTTDTASLTDGYIVWNVASGGAKTQTIPPASSMTSGQSLTIKDGFGDSGFNPITISPQSGSIDGSSSYVIQAAGASITLVANKGSNVWRKV